MQMVNTAIGWFLYEVTNNVLSQGWLGLAEVIPAIGLALYAGHKIDISNKRNVLLYGMLGYLVATIFLMWVANFSTAHWLGVSSTALLIYCIIFFTGVFRSFTGPTFGAILAQLVRKTDLPKAVSISSTSWQAAAVTGPIVSGFLITHAGITAMFGLAITGLVLACILISKIPSLPAQHANRQQKTWQSVKDGLRFVWNKKEVLNALSLDMFAVLFGGAIAMLPVFAKDILHVDASGLGILKAAQGIGTVSVLLAITRRPLPPMQGKILYYCIGLFGLCMIAFALSKNFWLSFFILLASGMVDGISINIRSTIMQLFVPDDMRGRVSSVNSMFINSSNEIGQFESGVAAKLMGTIPSVIFGGCMTLLVVGISWIKAPKLRNLKY